MGALAWLSVRVLQQDRELETRRRRERLQFAAGRLALEIERRLEAVEEPLAQGHGILFTANGIESAPGFAPLFQPDMPAIGRPAPAPLADAEALEYRGGDLARAAAAYGRVAESPDWPFARARWWGWLAFCASAARSSRRAGLRAIAGLGNHRSGRPTRRS